MRTTPTLHHLLALMLACSTSNATTAQSIGAGANCSAFICNDGELRTWGNNSYGQLGDSTIQAHSTGTPVYGSLSVREVAGGLGHTVALATDSTVWCWGRNDFGALGNGTTDWSTIPVQVTGLDNVVAIAAGDMFSVALRADGTAWAWGQNNYGQLGIGSTGSGSLVPVQVGITDLVAIAAGFGNLLAIASDGTVWGYGLNDRGQLGAGPGAPTICSTPVQALGIDSVVALSSSRYAHTVALCADGSVWTWGYNLFGQLGDGTTTERNTPAPVPGLSNMSAIAQQNGFGHTLAVRNDGTLWAWGYNLKGQLGLGSNNNNILVPTQVTSIAGLVFKGMPGRPLKERHMRANSGLFFDVFREHEPEHLLLRQAYDEAFDVQLELPRMREALERIGRQRIVLKAPGRFTPFAFPILVDRLREKLTSEQLEDRIRKMTERLEKA